MFGSLLVVGVCFLLASVTWAWAVGAEVRHGVIAGAIIGGVVGVLVGIFYELAPSRRAQVAVSGLAANFIGIPLFLLAVVGAIVGYFTQ